MPLYRQILGQALRNTWKHKYLWFFGLFAAFLGNGGELEFIFRGFDGTLTQGLFPGFKRLAATGVFSFSTLANIKQLAIKDPFNLFIVLSVLLMVFILAAFLIWLVIISQAALVNNVSLIEGGKKHSFGQGLSAGIKKFWPVFGLNFLGRSIIYILFIALALPIVISWNRAVDPSIAGLLFVISFIVFVPASIVISFIIKYAIAYKVIRGEGFWASLRSGWQLFTKNWLVSLEMAFILFFINFMVGVGLIIILLVLAVPFLFLTLLFSKLALLFNFWIIVFAALIVYLVLIVWVGAMLSTFQIYSWTSLFLRLISQGGVSKLVRLFGKEK